jgi:hypothetical protein
MFLQHAFNKRVGSRIFYSIHISLVPLEQSIPLRAAARYCFFCSLS